MTDETGRALLGYAPDVVVAHAPLVVAAGAHARRPAPRRVRLLLA